ncbi:MAG TPA: transporter substrate-binding domain-containing protein, partial [Clostridiales bacterium]|nr:transporter substrate-binding domain-containing protein [Clostridiales bacterium]
SLLLTVVLTGCGEKDSKVLRVAMECVYPPYNWTQPDDSNGAVKIAGTSDYAYGYDVMWAKIVAEELGYDLEIVKMDWDSLVPAVMTEDVDLVIAGQSITSDRLEKVDFTKPYYYASIVVLTSKDSPYASAKGVADLAGATCTSQIGTVWYEVCLPQIPDANMLPAQESATTMLTALDSGAVDLVVTDQPTALAACEVYPNMVMLDFTGTEGEFDVSEEEINIGMSMKKGNTELLDAINKILDKYTPEDFKNMMNEAIELQPMNQD